VYVTEKKWKGVGGGGGGGRGGNALETKAVYFTP